MRNVTIRPAAANDWKLLVKLDRLHSNTLGYFPREMMDDFIDRGLCLIAEENGQDAGFVTWRPAIASNPGVSCIYQTAVDLDCMRSSHGTYLFLSVCARSYATGNHRVQLWCRLGLDANEFWLAQGMTPVAMRHTQAARGKPTICWRIALHPTAVESLWDLKPPRKPITAGGRWARLDEPETHAHVELMDASVADYERAMTTSLLLNHQLRCE